MFRYFGEYSKNSVSVAWAGTYGSVLALVSAYQQAVKIWERVVIVQPAMIPVGGGTLAIVV
jgi:hypothetical protein